MQASKFFAFLLLNASLASADPCLATLGMVAPSLLASYQGMQAGKVSERDPHYYRGSGQTAQKENDKQIASGEAKLEGQVGSDYHRQAAGILSSGAGIAMAKLMFAQAAQLTGCAQTHQQQAAADDEANRKNAEVENKVVQADKPAGSGANFYNVQVITLEK